MDGSVLTEASLLRAERGLCVYASLPTLSLAGLSRPDRVLLRRAEEEALSLPSLCPELRDLPLRDTHSWQRHMSNISSLWARGGGSWSSGSRTSTLEHFLIRLVWPHRLLRLW